MTTENVDSETDPATAETPPEGTAEETNPNHEAAKWRKQLRETETERDTLRGTVEAMQRSAVEALASQQLEKPDALWKSGVELADMLGEDGLVDGEKVGAAVKSAIADLGLAVKRPGAYVPSEGRDPGRPSGNGNPWSGFLAQR